ncbi:MAG: gamma-glutamyltransferase [Myxococcales bacterium]|nr:gamma-glutamyltransferase [Myxococcales bacterium]
MRRSRAGIVACGHPLTADTAADVLAAGGNAVDAMVAAGFASFVCETPLSGIGGGGYMLIRHPEHGTELLDFFVRAPGLGASRRDAAALHFEDVEIDFGPTTQTFHIGYGAVAVPGNPAGFLAAHRRWGSIPLPRLLEPAIALARGGVEVTDWGATMFRILGPIVAFSPEMSAIFAPEGRPLRRGERFAIPELATVFDAIAREGHAGFYGGAVGEAMLEEVNRNGGLLTRRDLESYDVVVRQPLRLAYGGCQVSLTPPPSLGGTLIAIGLETLSHLRRAPGIASPTGGPTADGERLDGGLSLPAALRIAMDGVNEIRRRCFPDGELPSDFFATLGDEQQIARFLERTPRRAGNTTHLSIIDGDGWVASCTHSYGEGCGHLVPGTGIELNNMLGEDDLNPNGYHRHAAGVGLPSMMSPTLLEWPGGRLATLGSGGSNRIRTALLQVIVNLVDRGMSLEAAIGCPRMHWEHGTLQVEPGWDAAALEGFEREGIPINRWPEPNLFFGGAHGAMRDSDGRLYGMGDPRRCGVVRLVD